MRHFRFGGLIVGLAIFSSPATAAQIFDFTARVDQAGGLLPANTVVTGSFNYDAMLPPTSTGSGGNTIWADYQNPSIHLTLSFNDAKYSFAARASVFRSIEDGSGFYLWGTDGAVTGDLSIWNPLATFMLGTNLPTAFPALAQGPYTDPNGDDDETAPHGEVGFFDRASGRNFTATILTVRAADLLAVPEPSIWAMMIVGFGLVGGTMRQRKITLRYAG